MNELVDKMHFESNEHAKELDSLRLNKEEH